MKEHLNRREIIEAITPVIENTAMRYGLIPLEISLVKENEHWFLRIFIHSNEHPITHDDCKNITYGLGELLDELIPFKYYLEVSSPGIDRKLKSTREYIVFKGKSAIIKVKNPLDETDQKKFEGKILDYKEGLGLTILKYDTKSSHTIELENIVSVQLNDDIGEEND